MIIDNDGVLSDAQAYSTDAASTNLIDLSVTGRKFGAGPAMALVLFVDVAADGTTTDETYEFQLETDDDVAFGTPTDLTAVTRTYAQLTLNSVHAFLIDPNWTFERYVRVYFNGGGNTPTITGTLVLMPLDCLRKFKDYGNNYLVTH